MHSCKPCVVTTISKPYKSYCCPHVAGLDYLGPTPATLTFISGQEVGAQRCTVLSAVDDALIEDDESLNISLSVSSAADEDSVRYTEGEGSTTVTIIQDPNDST